MSDHDDLLHKARHSRELASRARYMARFLTQRADAERLHAYASELEALARELERRAGQRGDACPHRQSSLDHGPSAYS